VCSIPGPSMCDLWWSNEEEEEEEKEKQKEKEEWKE
jgi:hypothetical protein